SDPRDKIYSILGFANDAPQLGIYPDYSRASHEVYTDVAARLLQNHQNLGLLASSELQKRQPGLPSWVPDWSLNSKTSRLGWSFFSASRGSSAELRFGSGFSTLDAMGIF